jgi:hypothetical protein
LVVVVQVIQVMAAILLLLISQPMAVVELVVAMVAQEVKAQQDKDLLAVLEMTVVAVVVVEMAQ